MRIMNALEMEISDPELRDEQWETLFEEAFPCPKPQKRWQNDDWCPQETFSAESWKTETGILRTDEYWQRFLSEYVPFQIGTATKGKVKFVESSNELKFHRLSEQWYNETGMLSMIHKKSMHPAYQKIIGMGKDALPFIFQEMKKGQIHWLWALGAIHGEDIAEPGCSLKEAVDAWMKWGTENGYA